MAFMRAKQTSQCGWIVLTAVLAATVASCDRAPDGSDGQVPDITDPPLRVVSLAPALTQMVVDMNRAQLLVGTAQNDPATPEDLPVVGHWLDVNTEALMALRPTHVLTMITSQPVPKNLEMLASAHRFRLIAYPSPTDIWQISQIIYDDQEVVADMNPASAKCLAAVLGAPGEALHLVMRMNSRLAQLSSLTADHDKPNVLMIIGVNPLMACGPDTFHDQLLSICGGRNTAGQATVGAPVYDREKLLHDRPEVVLMLLPEAPPLGPIDSDPRLVSFRGLAIPAVEKQRVVLVSDPLVQLPSSSLDQIAAAMAKALHPDLSESIDRAMARDPLVNKTVNDNTGDATETRPSPSP